MGLKVKKGVISGREKTGVRGEIVLRKDVKKVEE